MIEGLAELVAECGTHRPTAPADRVAEGTTNWFMGRPTHAPDGTVALRQDANLVLTFRQEDVLEVRRHADRTLVRIREGANLLAGFEQVVGAAATCGCEKTYDDEKRPMLKWEDSVFIVNQGRCFVQIECFVVDVPVLGPTRICVPTAVGCDRSHATFPWAPE